MVTATVRRFLCSLHGHDALLHFEHGRMSLACTSCGWESPGWTITEAPETPAPTPAPHVPLRLVRSTARRVA